MSPNSPGNERLLTSARSWPAPAVADRSFRRLLGARLCVEIADNALAYALLIAIVQRTGSGVHSTLLIFAFTIPAILFGIPAGVIVDRLPKRAVLTTALVVRALLTTSLLHFIPEIGKTYAIIFLFATVGQVFGPVWVAVLPQLVGAAHFSRANALLTLVQIGGQVAGVVALAPLLLKTLGDRAVFVVATLFYLGALLMAARVGTLPVPPVTREPPVRAARAVRTGLFASWRIIQEDAQSYLAAIELSVVATVLKGLIILFPFYMRDVLQIAPENAVFVAAPAAIGAAAGLALLVCSLTALALVDVLRPFFVSLHLGMTTVTRAIGIPPVVTTAMLLAIPLGFGITLTMIAARTVLNERTPPAMQARGFATQGVIANVGSLVPLLLTGILTNWFGVRPAMVAGVGSRSIRPRHARRLVHRPAAQSSEQPATFRRGNASWCIQSLWAITSGRRGR